MFESIEVNKEVSPVAKSGAFNSFYTYSFISRSYFYAMISAPYYDFMQRFVHNWLWWADGWVPYFHSQDKGIPSTHLAQSLIEKTARKITGGRLMFKNEGKDGTKEGVNPAIKYLSDWAKNTDFEETRAKAIEYAVAAGTSLLKLNVDRGGELWAEAKRFDQFIPSVDARGNVSAVDCFIQCFTDLGIRNEKMEEGANATCFYVVEHRYFGDYTPIDKKECERGVPLCRYSVKKASGSVTNGMFMSNGGAGEIEFKNLPSDVKRAIGKAFRDVMFDQPMRLPFTDLGCELVKFTKGVTGIPELPFGESLLAPIINLLEEWDYYHAASMTDMYLGRGRVLAPKAIQGANAGGYNSGLDDFIYTKYPANPNGEDIKPIPVQFELRAAEWTEIRTRIIQDISIHTGLNISTIASFVSDTTAARTAREISTEENETADFINDKRSLMEKPINKILRKVLLYAGEKDSAVIRWSNAGMTNRYALAEIINMGKQGNFISDYKAVQMFNYDDDTEQVEEEYNRCMEDKSEGFDTTFGNDFGGDMNEPVGEGD